MLPPDLVMVFATPPANRPYSAEIVPVEVFVSSIASSMKSARDCLRSVSFRTTPFSRKRPSYDIAPEKVMLPFGPFPFVPGASSTAPSMPRPTGSESIRSAR